MPHLRKILGSEGSRVHIQLGNNGSYMLLLDWDNGDSEWQEHFCQNIPPEVDKQLNDCSKKGRHITIAQWGPDSSTWYIQGIKHNGTGLNSWWSGVIDANITNYAVTSISFGAGKSQVIIDGPNVASLQGALLDSLLCSRVKRLLKQEKVVYNVCLSHANENAFFILDDEGTEWFGFDDELSAELERKCNDDLLHVCEASDGAWVVIRENSFSYSHGVSKKAIAELSHFFKKQRDLREKRSEVIIHFQSIKKEKKLPELQQYEKKILQELIEKEKQRLRLIEQAQKRLQVRLQKAKAYLQCARLVAKTHKYIENHHNSTTCVVSFSRDDQKSHYREQIDIYYTTKTIIIYLYHPIQQHDPEFCRNVLPNMLEQILMSPRIYVGIGYHDKIQKKNLLSCPNTSIILHNEKIDNDSIALPLPEAQVMQKYFNDLTYQVIRTEEECYASFAHYAIISSDISMNSSMTAYALTEYDILVRKVIVDSKSLSGIKIGSEARIKYVAEDSTAANADLQLNDIIATMSIKVTSWLQNGKLVDTFFQCIKNISPVRFKLLRNGRLADIIVSRDTNGKLGIIHMPCKNGIQLKPMSNNCSAAKAGLKAGDIVEEVSVPIFNTNASSREIFTKIRKKLLLNSIITLTVLRNHKEKWVCTICFDSEANSEIRFLTCNHSYHTKCIDQWISNYATCPVCRKPTK